MNLVSPYLIETISMKRNRWFCLVSLFWVSISYSQEFPFDNENWEVQGESHVEDVARFFEGRPSLYLYRSQARLKDFEFFTGEIEFEVFVTESRGFPGVFFRMLDSSNYEEFYIRPHQSGNPDANQYTPVFNGRAAWQLYFGPEFTGVYAYKMNAWNRIKMVVAAEDAEVYINDMEKPLFYIPELKHGSVRGGVGLRCTGPSGFHFSNFKVRALENPKLKSEKIKIPPFEPGTVTSWSVSSPFLESDLGEAVGLDKQTWSKLNWKTLGVENKGYANLARVTALPRTNNTVFAKVVIRSDRDQIKRFTYGFSDRAKVYLNGEIIAGGQKNYASRDYRYLGTMGFFDDLYLKLNKGDNELWIAVSENFGGWGVMGKFDDLSAIELRD